MTTSWLRDFLFINEGTEVPEQFAFWCGISSISAVVGRNCVLNQGSYILYPNTFICLVAPSGRCRKSTAVGIGEKLVRNMINPPNILPTKLTNEALIEAMVVKGDPRSGSLKTRSEGYAVVKELTNFLNKNSYDSGLGGTLISFWDCEDNFEYMTKLRGKEILPETCISLLGASTVDWIKAAIPEAAIGGGLTSRILFIYVEKPSKAVARPLLSQEKIDLKVDLTRRLDKITLIRGEFQLTPEAWELYEKEYDTFFNDHPFFDDKGLSGYASRRHDHLLKVSMLVAFSEESPLVVKRAHIEIAIDSLKSMEMGLPKVIHLITASNEGTLLDWVLHKIEKRGSLTKTELMRLVSHKINTAQLKIIMDSLLEMGMVDFAYSGQTLIYKKKG